MKSNSTVRRNEEEWRQIITRQKTSGQSISAYCRGKNFSDKSFYVWRRKLRIKSEARCEKFLEVIPADQSEGRTHVLQVHTPKGYRLEVPQGFEGETLKSVLTILETI